MRHDSCTGDYHAADVSPGHRALDPAPAPRRRREDRAPEGSAGELADFRPHLLVYDDEGTGSEALGGVPYLIEVQYSDGMNARVSANGELSNVRDVSTEDLLEVVDLAIAVDDRG